MDKICPMMSRPGESLGKETFEFAFREIECYGEKCAWWGFTAPGKGDCIVGIIALQLNHIANK